MQSNIKDKVVFASPKSEEERAFVAGACVRKLGIEIPALLDFGNSTEQTYGRSHRSNKCDPAMLWIGSCNGPPWPV
jgi:hypothetical protein